MRSDDIKKGEYKAWHRSLIKASGFTDEEINKPLIGVACAANEIVPGHLYLNVIADAVKAGIRSAGGTPISFPAIGVCDGIAMGHAGMRYPLVSREHIADSVEIMIESHRLDGMVLIPNCDKIIPGMLMAAARLNIPSILVSGGPMLAGKHKGKDISVSTIGEYQGKLAAGKIEIAELNEMENCGCPTC